MSGQGDDDLGWLERTARERDEKEAMFIVMEGQGLRVAAGARISTDDTVTHFVEVASYPKNHLPSTFERMMDLRHRLDRTLTDLGLSSFDDDLDRIWELVSSEKELSSNLSRVQGAVARALPLDLSDPFDQ